MFLFFRLWLIYFDVNLFWIFESLIMYMYMLRPCTGIVRFNHFKKLKACFFLLVVSYVLIIMDLKFWAIICLVLFCNLHGLVIVNWWLLPIASCFGWLLSTVYFKIPVIDHWSSAEIYVICYSIWDLNEVTLVLF